MAEDDGRCFPSTNGSVTVVSALLDIPLWFYNLWARALCVRMRLVYSTPLSNFFAIDFETQLPGGAGGKCEVQRR